MTDPLAAIEKKLAVLFILIGILLLLTSGLWWVSFTILGRLPR